MLFFIIFINNTYAITLKSSPQQSVVLWVDDILTHENHNAIVKDVANMIIDIWGLKAYVDTNLVSVWNIEWEKLAYNAKNVYFSKNLIVIDTITTNKLNVPESWFPDNSILWSDIKNWEVKAEDLNAEVFASVKETWKLLWLNAYYLKGNVWIWTDIPTEALSINWNIAIKWVKTLTKKYDTWWSFENFPTKLLEWKNHIYKESWINYHPERGNVAYDWFWYVIYKFDVNWTYLNNWLIKFQVFDFFARDNKISYSYDNNTYQDLVVTWNDIAWTWQMRTATMPLSWKNTIYIKLYSWSNHLISVQQVYFEADYIQNNGVIFPDGTKQTTATVSDANNLKLVWNQTVNGDKKFIDWIELATWWIIRNVENNITLTWNRDDTLVTEFAAKWYISNVKSDKLDWKCGYSYAQNIQLEPKNLCIYWDASAVTTTEITELNKIRYIRDWIEWWSTANAWIHWVEIKAIQNWTNTNIAQWKTVTTNWVVETATIKPITAITDGDITSWNRIWITNEQKGIPKYVQVDLWAEQDIKQLEIYHYYTDERIYFWTKTEVSKDWITWIPVFDSWKSGLYKETNKWNIIPLSRIDTILKKWSCSWISWWDAINCANYEEKDNGIKLVETGWIKQWSNWTQSKSCKEYLSPTLPYKYEGATWSGVYNIKPNSTVIPVYCDMVSDGGGWTLTYKAWWQHSMKTTNELNIVTLKDNNYVWVWKLSDADIKTIYTNQFKVEYNWYTNWYCKFTNWINSYADNVLSPKLCWITYDANANYTTNSNSTARNRWFSTRDVVYSRILQLNYQDSRLWAHVVNGVPWAWWANANTCDMKTSWNDRYWCYWKVWIK